MVRMDRNELAAQTAQRVADEIKARGVKVSWLCEQTGIPRVTLHRRLTGQTPFNLSELDRIATALHVSTTELLVAA